MSSGFNANIFNSTFSDGSLKVRFPNKMVFADTEGGSWINNNFPRGLDIMETTPGRIVQSSSRAPDTIPLHPQDTFTLVTDAVKPIPPELLFEDSQTVVQVPVAERMKTNTELISETIVNPDGTRIHPTPVDQSVQRQKHMETYSNLMRQAEMREGEDKARMVREANRYLLQKDPSLYQALTHSHSKVEAHADHKEDTLAKKRVMNENKFFVKRETERKEELEVVREGIKGAVKDLIRQKERMVAQPEPPALERPEEPAPQEEVKQEEPPEAGIQDGRIFFQGEDAQRNVSRVFLPEDELQASFELRRFSKDTLRNYIIRNNLRGRGKPKTAMAKIIFKHIQTQFA